MCIYTTTLEPILVKISESEQPRTPPRAGGGFVLILRSNGAAGEVQGEEYRAILA